MRKSKVRCVLCGTIFDIVKDGAMPSQCLHCRNSTRFIPVKENEDDGYWCNRCKQIHPWNSVCWQKVKGGQGRFIEAESHPRTAGYPGAQDGS